MQSHRMSGHSLDRRTAGGSYDSAGAPGSEPYFTAGPNKGTGGLFGYLKPAATDLTEGNDQ
jgi:hypothetical protein